jgi:hypothetical protein
VAEIAGDLLLERKKLVGDAAAERRGHPTGAQEMKRAEEQEAFWKSFTTPEDDARMWAQGKAEGKDDATIRSDISRKKYQRRWEIWSKKADLPSKLAWAKEMQKLGPPPGMAPEPMVGPAGPAATGPTFADVGADPGAVLSQAPPAAPPPGLGVAGPAGPITNGPQPAPMAPPGMTAPTLADLLGETSPPPLGIPIPPRY